MRTKLAKMTSIAALGASLLLAAGTSFATPMTINGTSCDNAIGGEDAKVQHNINSIQSSFGTPSPVSVSCGLSRNPLAAGAVSGSFTVVGDNFAGATTSGTISAFNSSGGFLGSQSFSTAAATYSVTLTFPAAQLPSTGYTGMLVTMPASSNGRLRGIRVNQ